VLLVTLGKPAPAVEAARQAGGDLRVELIDLGNLLGQEAVAAAVGRMEADVVEADVVVAESVEQRIHLVRVMQIKRRVRKQLPD